MRVGEVVSALRRGWWIIASVAAVVTAAVVIYTLLQPKEYEAQALVFIDTERAASDLRSQVPYIQSVLSEGDRGEGPSPDAAAEARVAP